MKVHNERTKKKKLEAGGWRVASTKEFLELSDPEMAYIELKITLGANLRKRRQYKHLTQIELAKL